MHVFAALLPEAIGDFYLTEFLPWVTPVLRAFVVVVLGWWLSRRLGKGVERWVASTNTDSAVARFIGETFRYAIVLATLIATAGALGIETTSMTAVLASAGLAIGLGLQGSLANVASGLVILAFRPFSSGDWVTIAGKTGKVHAIGVMFSEIMLRDGTKVIVPNSLVTGNVVENHTALEKRGGTIQIGVAYGSDLDEVRAVLRRAVSSVPTVFRENDQPEFKVIFFAFGASSLDWIVHVWAHDAEFVETLEAVRVQIYKELALAKITIPFPQLDMHVMRLPPPTLPPSVEDKA